MHQGVTGFQHLALGIQYVNSLCSGPAVPGHASFYGKGFLVVKSGQGTRWGLWKHLSTVGIRWHGGEAASEAIP